jgi:hypothetical protein
VEARQSGVESMAHRRHVQLSLGACQMACSRLFLRWLFVEHFLEFGINGSGRTCETRAIRLKTVRDEFIALRGVQASLHDNRPFVLLPDLR